MGRIFGLDAQLLADAAIMAVSIFTLFTALSYLLFEPARKFLEKRKEAISHDLDLAAKDRETARLSKEEYNKKLTDVDHETVELMELARKRARNSETVILHKAEEEAHRIIKRAETDGELQKRRLTEEGRKEMVLIAAAMVNKVIVSTIDGGKQEEIFEKALGEMSGTTWKNQQ